MTNRQLLNEYAESHRHGTNQLIHNIFVPLIFLSVIGMLWEVKLPLALDFLGSENLNMAMIGTLLVFLYYLSRSFSVSLGMLIMSTIGLVVCYLADDAVSIWRLSVAVFVVSWVFQFIGHRIEGKRPSFLKDVEFLLVGPMWVLAKLYDRLNIKY